ncbi:Sec-independent protein translocase TatB [Pseudonocardia sp. TMWB2A]|uniref:Sec-independent protein translocase protein TatB n=1 Tax=Pseudonocardia sp. TMWB2A TaxID=687430 RepID=UPI00307F941C
MFENIGMPEILVLVVAGLFILGPERLPEAAAWVGRAVRQIKEFASGAQNHLKKELGPEFDQIQQPLNDLRSLRSLNPRTAITRSLFSDDVSTPPVKPNGFAPGPAGSAATAGAAALGGAAASTPPPVRAPQPPLAADERPPVDPDAT